MTSSKSYISLKEKYDRVIVLIDMDCFYCQVEELLDPKNLAGKPIAVVQYVENAGIIAVNYAARAKGVTRHMREKEAKAVCSDLVCIKVPSKFNKADISKYREAGKRVANVFEKFTAMLERASIDEAYMDITENVAERVQQMRDKKFTLTADHLVNTYIVGYDNIGKFIHEVSLAVDNKDLEEDPEKRAFESSKLRLLIGASIVSDIRKAVKEQTGYECSAGIAHNKILAKLVCGMNKPNKQTVLPIESTHRLFENLEISKIKSMGGKIGEEVCRKLDVKVMAELLPFGENDLQQQFGPRIGTFLYLMARGIDLEKVERKVMSKSIAVSKNFRGKNEIMNVNTLKFWLKELSKELKERLDNDHEETNRLAKQMIVQFTQVTNKKDVASSRTVPLNGRSVNSFTSDEIGEEAYKTIERNTPQLVKAEGTFLLTSNIKHLGISAGKLEDASAAQSSSKSVQDFLKNHTKKSPKVPKIKKDPTENELNISLSKFEYAPPKVLESKSDSAITNVTDLKSPKLVKSETIIRPVSINELKDDMKMEVDSEPSYSPTKSVDFSNEDEDSRQNSLKSQVKFTIDSSIKGEKTLRHWMQQLLTEFDEKVTNSNKNPSKVKLNWRQLRDDEIKTYTEDIPLDIFSNGIKHDFFVGLIQDSSTSFGNGSFLEPISFIEIECNEFSSDQRVLWKFRTSEHAEKNDCEPLETSFKQSDDKEKEQSQYPSNFTPTDDFYDEDLCPENMLEMELNVDEEEKEILKLENSFLGLSPAKTDSKESPVPGKSNNAHEEQPGPSYKSDYVELQKQPNVSAMLDVLNPLEECVECGKMIRKLDMLTHIDGHIAMKISLAQREEYRAEQKKRLLQKIENKSAKKAKLQKPKAVPNKINLIDKFARKGSENDTSYDNSIVCDICNQLIEIDNIQMHQDYHYAQKLRMEQMTIRTNTNSGTKRKRPNVSVKKEPTSAKSLKEYFKD